jgi:nucleoside-diphosphate-sugar epimerase
VARVLIVGCGCRGRELAAVLLAEGHYVRGTSRDRTALEAIEAAGAEPVLADPDRLSTLLPRIDGISAICWLMGSAASDAVHGPRLQSMLERLVDTHVRGFVYEAAGSAGPQRLEAGAALVRAAGETYRMPVAVVEQGPDDHAAWLEAATAGVQRVLG